jgi:ATP-dependent DNA helicase Q1
MLNEMANLIKRELDKQSGIIYCFSQREAEQIAAELCSRGIYAMCYHAQMNSADRTKAHENWLLNKCHVIVATIAFGMGIDKPDCRFVIHHTLSKSVENFYQESGRAGRDGLPARCILYFRYADVFRQASMVFTEQTGIENLHSMVEYCVATSTCRRALIARYFGDELWQRKQQLEGNSACNRMCDNCAEARSTCKIDMLSEAKLIINVLDKHSAPSTKSSKEEKEKRLTANKLAELVYNEYIKYAGKKSSFSQCIIERLILDMLLKEYLKEDFHFTPYNTICYLTKGQRAYQMNSKHLYEVETALDVNEKIAKAIQTNGKRKEESLPVTKKAKIDDDILCLDFGDNDVN